AGAGCRSRGYGGRRGCGPAAAGCGPRGAPLYTHPPNRAGGLASATAFAPASVGNVAIGFDILGFAVDALGDRVTVAKRSEPGVGITRVRGIAGELPRDPQRNTAGQALL